MVHTSRADILPGGSSEAAPPVPISNTVVKRFSADDTLLVRVRENRPLPGGNSSRLQSRELICFGDLLDIARPFKRFLICNLLLAVMDCDQLEGQLVILQTSGSKSGPARRLSPYSTEQ